eukprot:TRINITY_DN6568_c0_g1_i1.p2 TRINITY_DN6568_c0_g1~~TRINITY_DN6568_c0_g1_i1.p2  ORF type:complete len:238 (+),score=77.12 TRINITY_DN6568_c0_g1_i1:564-1277(+)
MEAAWTPPPAALVRGVAAAAAVQALLVLKHAVLASPLLPAEGIADAVLTFAALAAGAHVSEDCGNPLVGMALGMLRRGRAAGVPLQTVLQAAAAAAVLYAASVIGEAPLARHECFPRGMAVSSVVVAEGLSTAAAVALIGIYAKKHPEAARLPPYVVSFALAVASALWGGTCNNPAAAAGAFALHRHTAVLQATLIGCVTGTTLCLLLVLRAHTTPPRAAAPPPPPRAKRAGKRKVQ